MAWVLTVAGAVISIMGLLLRAAWKDRKDLQHERDELKSRLLKYRAGHYDDAKRLEQVIESHRQRIKQLQGVISDVLKNCDCDESTHAAAIAGQLFKSAEAALEPSAIGVPGASPTPGTKTRKGTGGGTG